MQDALAGIARAFLQAYPFRQQIQTRWQELLLTFVYAKNLLYIDCQTLRYEISLPDPSASLNGDRLFSALFSGNCPQQWPRNHRIARMGVGLCGNQCLDRSLEPGTRGLAGKERHCFRRAAPHA